MRPLPELEMPEQPHTAQPVGAPAPGEALRILLVTNMYPEPERPGWGAFVKAQADTLARLGHRVDVLRIRGKLDYLRVARQVRARTRGGGYDIVHAHYGLSGLSAIPRYSVPFVLTLHGSDALVGRLEPAISRLVRHFADQVVAVSPAIQARFGGEVIPCGVDLELFRPYAMRQARERVGLPMERRYVLFPYDPTRRVKRFDLLTAALDILASKGIEAEPLTVSRVGLEDMPWYYSSADAFVLCSDSEGSPTALKEALACNLPAAVTDVGDVASIVQDVDSAILCRQQPADLADGLCRAMSIPRGDVDSRSCMKEFDQARIAQRLTAVYRRLIG